MTITRSRQGSPSSAGFLVGGNPTRGAPEIDQKLLIQGLYPAGLCGEEFAAHLRDEFDDLGRTIPASNIKAEWAFTLWRQPPIDPLPATARNLPHSIVDARGLA